MRMTMMKKLLFVAIALAFTSREPRAQSREPLVRGNAPGYHLASLDDKTGKDDRNFGNDGVGDLMQGLGLPLGPRAVDDSGPLIISDANPYRQARPGETWDSVRKVGADGTTGILGQIA